MARAVTQICCARRRVRARVERTTPSKRAAAPLPGHLARIDGKSPVEYLTTEREKDEVRAFARAHLFEPATELAAIALRWGGAGPG
jgi:hypothetical protein